MGKARKEEHPRDKAILFLQTAIQDLERGDRIDALDSIRMAQKIISESLPKFSAEVVANG